jgi:hypothetical protein
MSDAPVIVLTYAHSGADRLWSLLAGQPDLACTSGTGILPLCEQASVSWHRVGGAADGPLPPLAVASIRALAAPLITSLLARAGKRRWCEFATATPGSADTFRQLFPGTRFLTVHRACPDMIHAALHAGSWGLAGPTFASFTSAHPASTAAALTAYWIAHTGPLIAFEQSHPGICCRIRCEDLPDGLDAALCAFLGLAGLGPAQAGWDQADWLSASGTEPAIDAGLEAAFPVDQIPPALLAQANDLMKALDYPPIGVVS